MPSVKDLIDELERAGVTIPSGRDKLLAAEADPRWTIALTDMVVRGPQEGIALYRTSMTAPTNEGLYRILLGYAFDEEQRQTWLNNLLPKNESYDFARHVVEISMPFIQVTTITQNVSDLTNPDEQ